MIGRTIFHSALLCLYHHEERHSTQLLLAVRANPSTARHEYAIGNMTCRRNIESTDSSIKLGHELGLRMRSTDSQCDDDDITACNNATSKRHSTRGVAREEAKGSCPPVVDWVDFYEKKLALLGRRRLRPAVLIRVIDYFWTYEVS